MRQPWQAVVAGVVLCAAAGWAIWVHFATAVLPFDDAYISYRYAENLAAGRGLVYNDGERVFGSSTPLYVLALTALRLLAPGDLATAAVRANAIGFVAAALLAGWLVRRLTDRPLVGAATAVAILVNPMLLAISTGGMEPYWFLCLAIAALLALTADPPRSALFGLLSGLAILTRAEGVLLGPIALMMLGRRGVPWWSGEAEKASPWTPRHLFAATAAAAVPLGAWALFSTLYFGSPIPQSVIAKATPIYLLPRGFTLEQIVGNLDNWVSAERLGELHHVRRAAIGVVLLAAGAATLLVPTARRRGAWMPIVLLIGLVSIYAIGNTLYFEWYWPPISVMLLLAMVVGLATLVTAVSARLLALGRRRAARAVVAASAVLLALWLAAMSVAPMRYDGAIAHTAMSWVEISPVRRRVLAYLAAGESIARIASPTDSVAAPEFGALGATWRGRILDPCGLVSPEALPFLPIPREQQARIGAGAISVDFVQATMPDWIVALPIFTSASLRTSEWFHANYRVVGTMALPFVIWDSRDLVIYRRRP
jgi:hypothetical protein